MQRSCPKIIHVPHAPKASSALLQVACVTAKCLAGGLEKPPVYSTIAVQMEGSAWSCTRSAWDLASAADAERCTLKACPRSSSCEPRQTFAPNISQPLTTLSTIGDTPWLVSAVFSLSIRTGELANALASVLHWQSENLSISVLTYWRWQSQRLHRRTVVQVLRRHLHVDRQQCWRFAMCHSTAS